VAIKIRSLADSVSDNGIKILVHGPAGCGKTVLCATTGQKTLMVSAEAGLLSLKGAPVDMDVAVVKTIDEVTEIYEMLISEDHGYKWLTIDSVSEVGEVLLSEEKAKSKDPRQAYGILQDEMTKLMRAFRDIPHLNVVMTAKQARLKDEYTGITTYVPSMPGNALKQSVAYLFDEVFALRVIEDEEKNEQRVLQTFRDVAYEAKDRSGLLDQYEKANLKHIHDKIYEV